MPTGAFSTSWTEATRPIERDISVETGTCVNSVATIVGVPAFAWFSLWFETVAKNEIRRRFMSHLHHEQIEGG